MSMQSQGHESLHVLLLLLLLSPVILMQKTSIYCVSHTQCLRNFEHKRYLYTTAVDTPWSFFKTYIHVQTVIEYFGYLYVVQSKCILFENAQCFTLIVYFFT